MINVIALLSCGLRELRDYSREISSAPFMAWQTIPSRIYTRGAHLWRPKKNMRPRFETPKLAVTTNISNENFAAMLERR